MVTARYRIGKEEDSAFYLKRDDSDFVVTAAPWTTQQARTKTLGDFLKSPEPQNEADDKNNELDKEQPR